MPPERRIGLVTLTVNNLPMMTAFYVGAMGLVVLRQDRAETVLGVAEDPLLRLRADPLARRPAQTETGLFHLAFLLPSRADLAGWLLEATRRRLQLVASCDHDVSESIYLRDPEGNGIEVYADRPRADWVWKNGLVRMGSYGLDLEDLARAARERWTDAPVGTIIGHLHLQVGALQPAEEFMAELGAHVTSRYPGASFFAWGDYHHHFAANIWNSRGSVPRDRTVTGLAEIELRTDGRTETLDGPWGTRLRLMGD
ncbi:VOC family protein [Falsirhodobacter sp. alg1]|uniref:VOC family protein n=1 Tax=Falsirhodobacter sp. alg1 TaxID=1472418 RepID=UPI000694979A|nr:VOC family protein [Falsirhodobacter sp. alg1]